jgi:hypothetical protein
LDSTGDRSRGGGVRLLRPLGVDPQQNSRVMPAPTRHHMHAHAGIEQAGFVRPPRVVQPEAREAELRGLADELLGGGSRIAGSRK